MLSINNLKIRNDELKNGSSIIPFYVDCTTCEKLNKSDCVQEDIRFRRKYNITIISSTICSNWELKKTYVKLFKERRIINESTTSNKKGQVKVRQSY